MVQGTNKWYYMAILNVKIATFMLFYRANINNWHGYLRIMLPFATQVWNAK